MTPGGRGALLTLLGFLSFCSVYASVVVVPLLGEIANEFGTTAGGAGLLAAAYGLPGILVAILAGPYSDRFGRRPFLIGGTALMAIGTMLSAAAPTFELLLAFRATAGIGASLVFPNIQATIGDLVAYTHRGRTLSTIIGMNTMATIVGVPAAGLIAEAASWRASVGVVGVLAAIAAVALVCLLPRSAASGSRGVRAVYGLIASDRSTVAALTSSLLGSVFWFTWSTYFVVFFQTVHGLGVAAASIVGLTLGLGILIGSQIGGRVGDRIGHRLVAAGAIVVAGGLLVVLTSAPLELRVATALNLAISTVIGARFVANQAILTGQLAQVRATVLSLSGSMASVALVAGSLIGGVLVDGYGFGAVGMFCLAIALLASVLMAAVDEHRDLAIVGSRVLSGPERITDGGV